MAAANAELPEDRRIVLRIGINLGDVIVEGSDLYGDGVNIAARLEALAEPGGICVSAKVHDEVRGKIDAASRICGEQSAEEHGGAGARLALGRWRRHGGRRPAPPRVAVDKPSIAVLPFANMSGDTEQHFFSDGITEDIITELARFRQMHRAGPQFLVPLSRRRSRHACASAASSACTIWSKAACAGSASGCASPRS